MASLMTKTPVADTSSSISAAAIGELLTDPTIALPWLLKESPSGADLSGSSTVTVVVTSPCALSAVRRDGISKPAPNEHVVIRDATLFPSPDLDGLLKPPQEFRSLMI